MALQCYVVAQASPVDDLRIHRLGHLSFLRHGHHYQALLDGQSMGHPVGLVLHPADRFGESSIRVRPATKHCDDLHVVVLCPLHDQPPARQILCHSHHDQKQLGHVRSPKDGWQLYPPVTPVGVGSHLVGRPGVHNLQRKQDGLDDSCKERGDQVFDIWICSLRLLLADHDLPLLDMVSEVIQKTLTDLRCECLRRLFIYLRTFAHLHILEPKFTYKNNVT